MKKHIIRSLLIVILIIFAIIITIKNNSSFAVSSDFTSLSMYTDKHVRPTEKVFLKINGNANEIKNMEIYLKNRNDIISAKVYDISSNPYFILPEGEYSDGNIYKIYQVKAVLSDNNEHTYKISDGSYIEIDNTLGNAWRDFTGVVLTNNQADYNGNYYINLVADTKEMVSITVNLTGTEDIVSYIENIDTRPFLNIDKIGEYSIKDLTIYYRDGGSFTYDVSDRNAANYLEIDNNKVIVNYLDIDEASKNIEENDYESTKDTTEVDTFKSSNYIWIFFLFVVIIAAALFFYMVNNED